MKGIKYMSARCTMNKYEKDEIFKIIRKNYTEDEKVDLIIKFIENLASKTLNQYRQSRIIDIGF